MFLITLAAAHVAICGVCAPPSGSRAQPPQPSAAHQQIQPHGSLAGRIVDPDTGAGLAFATVEIDGLDLRVEADAEGRFEIELPPGAWRLRARVEGFEPSPPVHVTVQAGGRGSIEIPYRLSLAADVRASADLDRGPGGGSVAASALGGRAVRAAVGSLDDPLRVLQDRPGVAPSHDARNDLLVRGGGAIETQIRIDGFEIANPSHFGAHGGSGGGISLVPPALVDRLTIQPGAFSVAFGERASGLVDVSLRAGNRERLAGGAGASVAGIAGAVEGPLGRGSWIVSGRRSLLEHVARGGSRAVPRYRDAILGLETPIGARHVARVLALGGDDGVRASSRSIADRVSAEQRVALLGWSLASAWSPVTASTVHVSVGTHEIDATVRDPGDVAGADRAREIEARVRVELRRTSAAGTLVAGATVKRASLDFDLQAERYRNAFGGLVAEVSRSHALELTDAAAYLEATRAVTPSLDLTGGMRLDRWGHTGDLFGSPRLRLEQRLSPLVRITASAGKFRQAVPYVWLGSHEANGDLGPISSNQATAGVEAEPRRGLRILAEVFVKRYRHYPIDLSAPSRVLVNVAADFESPIVGELADGGEVRAAGLDAGFAYDDGGPLRLSAGYSRWRVIQRGLDRAWRRAEHDVPHQIRASAGWSPGPRWSIGGRFRFAKGRPYTPFDAAASIRAGSGRYDPGRIHALAYPDYHRLDVRVDRAFRLRGMRLLVFAEIENVYDRDNVHVYEWNRNDRSPAAVYQWGRLPLAGVHVEF
jgi:outer membrane receptor protein involved in Fe transport